MQQNMGAVTFFSKAYAEWIKSVWETADIDTYSLRKLN